MTASAAACTRTRPNRTARGSSTGAGSRKPTVFSTANEIEITCPEFTALCPKTGQPDFGTIVIQYIPDASCLELKSLKLYVWSFRDEGHFHEDVTNRILDDLAKAVKPRYMRLTARFYVRGGIFTNVVAEHRKKGWKPAAKVELAEFPAQSNTRG
jgi:7-cyano-7-deazaguanine reductase